MADNAFEDLPPGLIEYQEQQAAAAMPQQQQAAAAAANAFADLPPGLTEAEQRQAARRDDPNGPAALIRDGSAGPTFLNGAMAAVQRLPAQLGRATYDAVTGLPLMAMDAGVAGRNLIAGRDANGNYPYTLPSADMHAAEDQVFGAPQTTGEKIGTALSSMLLSGGAAGSNLPASVKTIGAAIPESSAQVPANFMTPQQSQAQLLAASLQKAQAAGYKVPPSTTNPTMTNKVLETVAGKINTQNAASLNNAEAVTRGVSQDLGLNPDAPLTLQAIQAVKKDTGAAWDQMRGLGTIQKDPQFSNQLSAMRADLTSTGELGTKDSPLVGEIDALTKSGKQIDPLTLMRTPDGFTGTQAVNKITDLRNSADIAFRQGDGSLGRGYRQLSQALEDQVQRAAESRAAAGDKTITPDVVQQFKNARQLYAKASSAEDALDGNTNQISLQKLGQMYANGEPLSGNMAIAGQFANSFKKAALDPTKIGSSVNHLDMYAPVLSVMEGNTLAQKAAGFAVPIGRAGAKAYLMSGSGQRGAVPSVTDAIASPSSATQASTAALVQALTRSRSSPASGSWATQPAYGANGQNPQQLAQAQLIQALGAGKPDPLAHISEHDRDQMMRTHQFINSSN